MSLSLNVSPKTEVTYVQNTEANSKHIQNSKELEKDTICIKENTADKILRENKEQEKNNQKSSQFTNVLAFPTVATFLGSGVYSIYKIIKINPELPDTKINKNVKNILKKSGIASLFAVTTWLAGTAYFSSNRDKYIAETKDYFNNINKTGANLAEKEFNSPFATAFYNGVSGEIYINKNNYNDSWNNYKNKFTIKHELIHAKQYETVARTDDGIRKLNYAIFKNDANRLKKDLSKKQMISEAYNDITSDKSSKYENTKFSYNGYEISFKDYIIAMYKLVNDKEKNYTDIPILINAKHYNSVREKFGKLTPEEELKAKEYYNGILNYISADSILDINPFSKYRNGILEKEAYKENPWYTMLI